MVGIGCIQMIVVENVDASEYVPSLMISCLDCVFLDSSQADELIS